MPTTEAKPAPSPDDLPKEAVVSKDAATEPAVIKAEPAAKPAAPDLVAPEMRKSAKASADRPNAQTAALAAARRMAGVVRKAEPRLVAVAGSAMLVGAILGAGAISVAGSRSAAPNAAITSLAKAIDAGRGDTAKLAGAIARLDQTVAELKAAAETARKDTKSGAMTEKLAQLDRSLSTKLAGLGERIDQAEREQTSRIAGLANRALAAKAEPTQTGSLAEPREKAAEAKPAEARPADTRQADTKPAETAKAATGKPPVLETYALRDIYEGAAIIEGRNRRLFQVVPGDTLPGAGRVEGIERQGRSWVVVTRQGLVTPQSW
jgi:hypothetical protein